MLFRSQRNALDSQLRIAASVGSFATLRHLGPGIKNIFNNTIATPARLVDRYRSIDSGRTLSEVQQASADVVKELNTNKSKIAELEAKLSINKDNLDLQGELNTLKLLQEEKQSVYDHYTGVLNRAKGMTPKQRIASGSYEFVGSDGKTYVLDDAFGGPLRSEEHTSELQSH